MAAARKPKVPQTEVDHSTDEGLPAFQRERIAQEQVYGDPPGRRLRPIRIALDLGF
jgi:hypothetical protein